jgi:hypothetical protein
LPAKAATPLDDLIEPAAGKQACFIRIYDHPHLKAHPKQKTRAIVVWMKYDAIGGGVPGVSLAVSLAITQRGDPATLYSQGGCEWSATANRNTSDNRLIAAYPRDAGAVCLQSARPDVFEVLSAEEGGNLILDRGRDRDTLMVYLDDGLMMVKRANRARPLNISFGADDRVFMLRRTDLKNCAVVEEAVTQPEPGVKRR